MAIYNNDAVWLRPLGAAKEKTLSSIGKLSGGIGLQSAADDPAGMAVSINLDAELRSLHQAGSNTVQALSMLRTAEGGLSSITESLIRIRELGVMAGSSTYSDSQREMIQAEIASLQEGIDNVAASTEYNGTPLLDGSAGELVFQVGTGPTASSQIEYETRDLSAAALGIAGASVLSVPDAQALIDTVDQALSDVGQYQADVGSKMNRVESAGRGIETSIQNASSSLSQIRDTDYARESTNKASSMVQLKMAIAMAAQGKSMNTTMVQKLLG